MKLLIILVMFLVSCGDIIVPEDKIPDGDQFENTKPSDKDEGADEPEVGNEVTNEVTKDECASSTAKVVYKDSDRTIYACVQAPSEQEDEDELMRWCRYKATKTTEGLLKLTYVPRGDEEVRVLPVYYLKEVSLDVRIMLTDASGQEICRILNWDGKDLDVYQLYNRVNISVKIAN